ncbi:MAG: 50S ribosomal protein L25/general stress protein Ctc [Beijerinckiaceae bacterium]|jgi:large subunit ribosomal protein L25|nr:50S ribosomal protein L25/general stress protein Ctc [Beijerinckiaceae bacterium]
MSTIKNLSAARRERAGKGAARAVRREGRVPAVIYGAGQPPVSISLDFKDTNKLIYAGHFLTTVFDIEVEGEKIRAIPRDYQLDVVRDFPIHVDFLRLGEGAIVRVEIPVHVVGQETSPGLKAGGALNLVRHTVEFNVPADNIPEFIEVDVSKAKLGDSIHISAVKLPAGAKPVISDRDFTVVTIAGTGAKGGEG